MRCQRNLRGIASKVYKPDDAEAGSYGRGKEQNGGMVLQDGVGRKHCRESCVSGTLYSYSCGNLRTYKPASIPEPRFAVAVSKTTRNASCRQLFAWFVPSIALFIESQCLHGTALLALSMKSSVLGTCQRFRAKATNRPTLA